MAKSLNDILKRFEDVISGKLPPSKIEPLTTGENPGVDYADKMKDGRDFVGMHTVEKHPDRNGNGDDVFKGSTTKAKMERHGHEPKPKDIQVYNKTQQQNEEADNDDGWYAHKEMHGSKAVSKEEWKKGIRLNKDGKKVQTKKLKEAKDNREYDYEGEMAVTKLKTIVRAAEHLIKMMEPNTNLPEWVQSKIIKAEDYITTAHDYLMSEMNEEVEELDEGGSQYRSAAGSGKNTNPNLSKLARKLAFEKPKSYRPPGEKSKAENRAILDAEVAKFMKKGGKIRKEEVEELDETKKPEVSISDNVAHVKNSQGKVVASYSKKIHGSDFVKRANAHMAKLNEAKCNMSEAGTMCEVHGMKACSKEETKPSDKQPMYNGKDKNKKGRQLILDKDLKEMATSQNQAIAARIALKHKREGTMPPKGTASHSMMGMSEKQLHDYTKAEKGAPKKVEESVSDQRSARSTASEKAREKIANALERKKLEKMKHKLKTEQSAPAETVIRMPSGDVGDTGRV